MCVREREVREQIMRACPPACVAAAAFSLTHSHSLTLTLTHLPTPTVAPRTLNLAGKDADLCFTIVSDSRKEVFEAPSPDVRNAWIVAGLEAMKRYVFCLCKYACVAGEGDHCAKAPKP